MLRIAILTTDTLHHRYFLQTLHRYLPAAAEVSLILFETRSYPWRRNAVGHFRRSFPNLWNATVMNPYIQLRNFNKLQNAFERQNFFADGGMRLPSNWRVEIVESANDQSARDLLAEVAPDVLYVYGTGKLIPEVFEKVRLGAVNAHGGKLPDYRGLDTNLWVALDGRPDDMRVTLHKVDAGIDTGPVYMERPIPPDPLMAAHTLRYFTTLVCCSLFVEITEQHVCGLLETRPQNGADGCYYRPMPWILKRKADRILRAWGKQKTAHCS